MLNMRKSVCILEMQVMIEEEQNRYNILSTKLNFHNSFSHHIFIVTFFFFVFKLLVSLLIILRKCGKCHFFRHFTRFFFTFYLSYLLLSFFPIISSLYCSSLLIFFFFFWFHFSFFSIFVSFKYKEERLSEAIENMQRIFTGVHGKLGDLCRPMQRKYAQVRHHIISYSGLVYHIV